MRPDQVRAWLTEERFQAFEEAVEGSHERAVALYNWNAEVSAAFMEVLYHLEVLLRNAVDRQFPATAQEKTLSIVWSDVWLCSPVVLSVETRERVNEAICRLERRGKTPTRGRVIASLSLGFWAALFGKTYEHLWRSNLAGAFPNGTGKRNEVSGLVAPLLHFRNRIAHHEAIFSDDLTKQYGRHVELARLIDPEAASYISTLSRVEKLLLEKP